MLVFDKISHQYLQPFLNKVNLSLWEACLEQNWPSSSGGVKWPPNDLNFFLTTFHNICTQKKKSQLLTPKRWIFWNTLTNKYLWLGCFRKSTFFELEDAIFFSVYKYYEKSSGKNSGHLEVIWPPHWMMANFVPNRPPRGLNWLYSRMVGDIDAIFCQTPAFMLYYVFFTSSMHKPCISGFSISLRFFSNTKGLLSSEDSFFVWRKLGSKRWVWCVDCKNPKKVGTFLKKSQVWLLLYL